MKQFTACTMALAIGILAVCGSPSGTPSAGLTPGDALPKAQVASEAAPAAQATAVRGARGAEHCALSIGVFVGGALGFFANPFLGTTVMRFGFMAAALHC